LGFGCSVISLFKSLHHLLVVVAIIAVVVYSATAIKKSDTVIIPHADCGFGSKGQENGQHERPIVRSFREL
jgi:predicted membrane protein